MGLNAFQGMKPFPQLLFSTFIVLVSFFFILLLAMVVGIPIFGFDSIKSLPMISELEDPAGMRVLKYFQVVQSIGLFIIPPLLIARLFHGHIASYLFLHKRTSSRSILLATFLIIFSLPLVNFIAMWNAQMELPGWMSGMENWMKNAEENAARLTEAFLNVETIGGLLFNLFMIALLPAIGEEFLFRGVIQRIFTNWTRNYHWGIWISAILFSALHLQFYGFVPRLLLGVLFGYLLVWSGSMWLPVTAHFLNNGLAVVAMFLIDKNQLDPGLEEIGSTSGSYYLAVISLAVTLLFLWQIKKENTKDGQAYLESMDNPARLHF
ncbi:MAG: CPBP family intramembrane glutamic endopeptidase [Mariniphaga sp.]|nr:CPBP family intramembrane metalloprotease [Mariniphaga sp.]MDD4424664.1 CPBP family intramembrane metalloprotease [Mariniphaga sp.]